MSGSRGPIVHVIPLGRRAHMVAWHSHAGGWWAALHWLEVTPSGFGQRDTFTDHHLCVRADQVEQVDGWDYTSVPRRTV